MFGITTFSEAPFSALGGVTDLVNLFQDLIANPNLPRTYLIEIDAYEKSSSAENTQYFSDSGYTTKSTESPASQYYDARVVQPLEYNAQARGSAFSGLLSNAGKTVLVNSDGGIDDLLEDYTVDAREYRVYLGREEWDRSQFNQIFKGAIQRWEGTRNEFRVEIRDSSEKLNKPIQDSFYAGTGDEEGGDDLKDKPKPLCYGKVFNIPAIPVDTTDLLYQIHDGQINAVNNVYDRGAALTQAGDYATVLALLAATTGAAGSGADIEAGEYATSLADGFFRLGGNPDGTITCDAEGDAASSYVNTTGDIINRIVRNKSGLVDGDIDTGSISNANIENGSVVGIWINQQRNILDVLSELVKTIGGFYGFKRNGQLTIAIIKDPSDSSSVFDLEEHDIIDIEQIPIPQEISPPNWRRQVSWGKNYQVQNDIAGSVAANQRAFIQEQFRIAVASDSNIQDKHILATDPPLVPSLFTTEIDAQTEADRLLALFKQDRFLYRIVTKKRIYDININDVLNVTYPRWDLTAGKDLRVVSVDFNAQNNQLTFTGFT